MSPEASGVPERRPYTWLPVLILGMSIVATVIGAVMLRSIEVRLVEAAGGNLMLASAEIADKLDRLLFERYGDAQMMARAFAARSGDKAYLTEYLQWMKTTYGPVYLWLGVADLQGRIVAATDPSVSRPGSPAERMVSNRQEDRKQSMSKNWKPRLSTGRWKQSA